MCYKYLKKHNVKVDLNCLDPGNVHLNHLNASVLNVLRATECLSADRLGLRPTVVVFVHCFLVSAHL